MKHGRWAVLWIGLFLGGAWAAALPLRDVSLRDVSVRGWQVDYAKSRIRFVIRQMNVPVEGGFARFAVQAEIEPNKLEQGRFRVDLEVASISTGSAEGDEEVQRPTWFDAARFPKATFVSQRIRKVAEGRYVAQGGLFIKGRNRPAEVLFEVRAQGVGAGAGAWLADGRFVVRRSDFGIGGGDWNDVVADEAEIRFVVAFKK